MTEDYKKEQSILNKWFHLRAATQFANSSGISGSSTACCTPSTLTCSWMGTSFSGVILILERIELAHYLSLTKCVVSSETRGLGQGDGAARGQERRFWPALGSWV